MLFKNSVRTSKRTPHFTITKINWLTLFKEIIAVYSENDTKPINTKCSITDCQCRNANRTLLCNKLISLYMGLLIPLEFVKKTLIITSTFYSSYIVTCSHVFQSALAYYRYLSSSVLYCKARGSYSPIRAGPGFTEGLAVLLDRIRSTVLLLHVWEVV
jgi:hypothetical protein